MAERSKNVFFDEDLHLADKSVFGAICYYDRGRGCWASRDLLARKVSLSLSAVDHSVARLKARGYLRTQKRGPNPVMVFVDPKARQASGFSVPVGIRSDLHHGAGQLLPGAGQRSACTSLKQNHEQQQRPTADPDSAEGVVVGGGVETCTGDTNPWPSLRPEVCQLASRLVHQGHPRAQVEAAVRYAEGKRGEVVNRPGLVRSAVEGTWDLPEWCFREKAEPVPVPSSAPAAAEAPVEEASVDLVERRHLNARRARDRRGGGMKALGEVMASMVPGRGRA